MSENRTSIGKYDFIKGIAMILIIMYHTRELYFFSKGTLFYTICLVLDCTIQCGANGTFFLISGANLRKRPVLKMLKMQFNGFIKPYLYTGIARSVSLLVIHYLFFRYMPAAIIESLRSILGFVFGLRESQSIMGFFVYSAGPMWFFISMMMSLCLLNIVINYAENKYFVLTSISITTILYFLLSYFFSVNMFCLNTLYFSYIMCFLGYYLKRKGFFNQKLLSPQNILLFLLTITASILYIRGQFDYDLFNDIGGLLWSLTLCNIVFHINIKGNFIVDIVSTIGRYSLYVFCVHTIELMAIPWYLFAEKFSATPVLGFFLQLLIRGIIITVVCVAINYYNHRKKLAIQ